MMIDTSARCLPLFLLLLPLASLPAAADDAGAKAFVAQECNKCHSVESHEITRTLKVEKMHGPDMSEVGSRRDAATIKKIVTREMQIEGHDHKGKWKGTNKDLEVIANWLASLQ